MADNEQTAESEAAQKAYAAAAETAVTKPAPTEIADTKPVEFPPAEKRIAKAEVPAPAKAATSASAVKTAPADKTKPAPKAPASKAKVVAKATTTKAPAAKPGPRVKPAAPKPASKASKPAKKPVAAKVKSPAAKSVDTPSIPTFAKLKEIQMTKTTDITEGLQNIMTETKTKAKEAFEKGTAAFGEASEFTKGNVEALVESGKILSTGLQDMGTNLVAEGRSAFETMTADAKELAAAKSPTDFFKLQSEILRRNFDSAVTYGSKNSESLLKLANEVIAPISGRVSLVVQKAGKAA